MIPRTARKLETTLVSYSRQRLPRPARYSTPSKRVNAPALAAAYAPPPEYPAFMPQSAQAQSADTVPFTNDMEGFLQRRQDYTIMATPRPDTPAVHSDYYTDTPTQDKLALIDACLYNLFDVPRAKQVFEQMRHESVGNPVLSPKLYNAFLHAYLKMAEGKEPENRLLWVDEMWLLFNSMLRGEEKARPTEGTYALMLLSWHKFNPESDTPVIGVPMHSPNVLVRQIVDDGLSVTKVLADRSFTNSEEALNVMTLLSRAAVAENLSRVVNELGQVQTWGTQEVLQDGVPDVKPVLKEKVTPGEFATETDADGNVTEVQKVEYEVPFNLSTLRKHLAQVTLARRVLPEDVAARQKLLEESVYETAMERLKHEAETLEQLSNVSPRGLKRQDLQRWMWDWHGKLQKKLKVDVAAIIEEENTWSKSKREREQRLSPFLALIKIEKLSLITILELMRLHGTGGVTDGMKTARALITVGKALEREYQAEMCKKNKIPIPNSAATPQGSYFSRFGYTDLHARRVTAAKYMDDSEEWISEWSQNLRLRVGSFLVDALMTVATVKQEAPDKKTGMTVFQEMPAFHHTYEYMKGHKLGVIKLHGDIAAALAKDQIAETLHPRHLPMLIKPKPWLGHDQGGYIYNRSSAMRFKESVEQQAYLAHASNKGNVELVYAGLDVLGSTPWAVNRKVFDVVLKVWNSGERLGKMPPAVYDGARPEKPEGADHDPAQRSVWMQRDRGWMQAKAANHSDRCSVNYKIEIARAFLHDVFYLPHNLDFRGRAYPIPPHLNHIGDDLSRGMLLFGEKRALGERGLRWLKIHLANLAGFDKGSFDERVNFVHENLENIYESATNPLEGKRWWMKADDPWQCLATCFELHAALESGNPLEFQSALPVHQDGTCNGLQHYAALGGDSQGAKQVNLSVTDRPSDVYTYVADMVEAQIKVDIEKTGNKYAKMLQGRIARKVVKQTVMTTVYGVTFIGARDQIERQLSARGEIPEEECWGASSYLAKKVLSCIGDLFRGAKDIQTWLNLVARLISKSIPPDRLPDAISEVDQHVKRGDDETKKAHAKMAAKKIAKEQMTSVIWTTPLGLPIVQPYRKVKRKQIMTSLQSVYISDPNIPAGVNSQKQASAFPPNFIHSLDATHMMLTALECRTRNLTFASVHDSYWTHACSIDEMSTVIRDTFIALHSSDVLKKLREEFQERYKGFKVPVVTVRTGTLLKKLGSYESAVIASKEHADSLNGVSASLIVDLDDPDKLGGVLADIADETEADSVEDEESASVVKPRRRGRAVKLPKADMEGLTDAEAAEVQLQSKFVDLVDLFPALPSKGDFDVNTIKGSAYFFS